MSRRPRDSPAGYTLAPRPGHAALVLGNGDRTLFNAFWYGDNWSSVPGGSESATDLDRDGMTDAVELWVNAISHVGGLSARRWLAADRSGTLAPGRGGTVPVSVDATGLSPGTYTGTVALVTNSATGSRVSVPVRLVVTAARPAPGRSPL